MKSQLIFLQLYKWFSIIYTHAIVSLSSKIINKSTTLLSKNQNDKIAIFVRGS